MYLPFHLLHSFFTPCPPNSASKEDKEIYFTTLLSIALAYMGTNRHDIVDLILPAFDIDDADVFRPVFALVVDHHVCNVGDLPHLRLQPRNGGHLPSPPGHRLPQSHSAR